MQLASKWTGKFSDLGAPQVVDGNQSSPLDVAQYPAGLVGALVDGTDPAALPAHLMPTQGAAAGHPAINPVILKEMMTSPYASDTERKIGALLFDNYLDQQTKANDLGGKVLYGTLAGTGIGGAQGAAESRDWTNLPQTGKDAARGAGIGGLIGGGIPIAGRAIGAGYNSIANLIMGKPADISRGASKHLINAIIADTPAAAQSGMAQLGPDAMSADAGPAFLGKAQGASLNSDEGRSVLQSALTARNEGTNQRIMGDVNRVLGPAEDPQTVTNAIKSYRSTVDAQSYPVPSGRREPVAKGHPRRQIQKWNRGH